MAPWTHYVGSYSLLLTLLFSLYATASLTIGKQRQAPKLLRTGYLALYGTFFTTTLAAASLFYALLNDQFDLSFVAERSSMAMPVIYKIGAFWGGQQGSLLLWLWMLTAYAAVVVWRTKREAGHLTPYVGAVMGGIASFFALLVVSIEDPFALSTVVPADGNGLNPLLRNPSMMAHPLFLYGGFTGFAVPFAFCISALALRDRSNLWLRLTRRWTLIAWGLLSVGIILGGNWAYQVLGWGGYWAWDPVENASFIPWLVGTAYIHSAMIEEKRGMLKGWNTLLIMATYILTLFGTMLTRSGILASVHAFAESPIGTWFLIFIGIVLAGSTALVLRRTDILRAEHAIQSSLSREAVFLANNVILTCVSFAVLFGTLLPIVSGFFGAEISVGAPYFNQVTGPLFVLLLLLMGLGPMMAWRRGEWRRILARAALPLGSGALFSAILIAGGLRELSVVVGFSAAFFLVIATVQEVVYGVLARKRLTDEPMWRSIPRLFNRNPRRYGGYLVHIAIAVMAVAIIGSWTYQQERLVSVSPGASAHVAGYTFTFDGLLANMEGNVPVIAAPLQVWQGERQITTLTPAQAFIPEFVATQGPTSRIAVERTLARDLYAVLMGFDESGTVGLELYVNPLVSWIWIGGALLVLGTLFSVWPRRSPAMAAADERALDALRDLEYDFAMGKLSEADYRGLKVALTQDALNGTETRTSYKKERTVTPTGLS